MHIPEKNRALVLPGGGGRGAYQVGVVKALLEAGIKFNTVFGTSIGALNAALLAQGDLERLEKIWSTLTVWNIFKLPSARELVKMVLGHKLGMLDITPLENLLYQEVDLNKIKQSSMKVRLVTTDLCSLETRMFNLEEVSTKDELINILLATSALPIAFPPRKLNGEGLWVDGGLVKNTPLKAAVDQGAEEIFMVLMHPESINVCPANMWQLIARCLDVVLHSSAQKELEVSQLYNRLIKEGAQEAKGRRSVQIEVIQPSKSININLLEIDPAKSKSLIQDGYHDAYNYLERLYGNRK